MSGDTQPARLWWVRSDSEEGTMCYTAPDKAAAIKAAAFDFGCVYEEATEDLVASLVTEEDVAGLQAEISRGRERVMELERERDTARAAAIDAERAFETMRAERDELFGRVSRVVYDSVCVERDAYRAFAVKIGEIFAPPDADDMIERHMAPGDLADLAEHVDQQLAAGRDERAGLRADFHAALNSLDLALGALARLAGDSAPVLTGPTQLRTDVVRAWVERVEGDVRLLRPEAGGVATSTANRNDWPVLENGDSEGGAEPDITCCGCGEDGYDCHCWLHLSTMVFACRYCRTECDESGCHGPATDPDQLETP